MNDSFESLFRRHHKALCDLAYNIVCDKDAAKDIVQDVFYKLWKNRSEIQLGDQIHHYLFRATSHTALNYLRFNKKIIRISDSAAFENFSVARTTEENMNYQEVELKVRQAIDNLPPRCKTIYLMSRHEGLKYQEIAEALNVSLKTVENQMGIALQKLRKELKPFLPPELIVLLLLSGLLYMVLMS